jgi:hypothetical protein
VSLAVFACLLIFTRLRPRLGLYSLVAASAALGFLILFVILSTGMGIMRFGEPQSYRYPDDYLAGGPLGWVTLLIPVFGLLTPIISAYWLNRRNGAKTA